METSSLQQVDAINRTGIYRIGKWETAKLSNDNCLELSFQPIEGQNREEYVKKLTEFDLHELRSKLMLISKTDESKVAVEAMPSLDSLPKFT